AGLGRALPRAPGHLLARHARHHGRARAGVGRAVGILAALTKDRFGNWSTLLAYLQDLNRRDSGALAALNSALAAAPDEQRELGAGDGALVLSDVAADARVQKGARLAAIRCAMEAGISGPLLVTLYVGGGELVTDPRLGAHAKKLVELGVPASLADPIHPST